MGRAQYGWANYGESPVMRGDDEADQYTPNRLRDRIAPGVIVTTWRSCEALVLHTQGRLAGKYVPCGRNPVERHHRLTRARGGTVLDDAGEWYHLMDLCPEHHRMADGGDARAGGLVIDGYVTTCTQCQRPEYTGPDAVLLSRYGSAVHLRCVSEREAGSNAGQGLRGEARA